MPEASTSQAKKDNNRGNPILLALRCSNDGIWDWDLINNRIYYSPRWKEILGYDDSEIGDSPDEWLKRVHPEDIYQLEVDIAPYLNGMMSFFQNEHRIMHKDGTYRWVLIRAMAEWEDGKKTHHFAGSLTDISERKLIEERLRHDSMHDPLSHLPNRSYFLEQLTGTIERARRRSDFKAAILVINLDRFNIINDSLGRAIGDQMLIAASKRLKSCLYAEDNITRSGETVAHFGGDEFAVLLEGIKDITDATRVANRIQKELASPFSLQNNDVFTSASIGIAITGTQYKRAEDLLRDADTAMYRAKSSGRGKHQIFDTEMHAQSLALLQLEADLRRAIEREEFEVYYQPIVSLATRDLVKVEALLRWHHPERGMVMPGEFIPIAEESGLIVPIGEWVLENACKQAKSWSSDGFFVQVAVNVSPHQLHGHNLPEIVKILLNKLDLPPQAISLEVTESAAMQDFNQSIQFMNELKNMGVDMSIDDFGMYYSSLGYLKLFPVKTLKIDRSFICDIDRHSEDAAITSAIIAMGHILNLYVVAEGVETSEQIEFLSSQYCDEVQGYYICRPQPASVITQMLKSDHRWLPDNPVLK